MRSEHDENLYLISFNSERSDEHYECYNNSSLRSERSSHLYLISLNVVAKLLVFAISTTNTLAASLPSPRHSRTTPERRLEREGTSTSLFLLYLELIVNARILLRLSWVLIVLMMLTSGLRLFCSLRRMGGSLLSRRRLRRGRGSLIRV